MKIISKFKDYYDYLQGIYGIDDKLVLDRRSKDGLFKLEDVRGSGVDFESQVLYFFIAGQSYYMEYYKGKLYYTLEERKGLQAKLDKDKTAANKKVFNRWRYSFWNEKLSEKVWNRQNKLSTLNFKKREPIILKYNGIIYTNILLKEFNFPKIVPPTKMFEDISLFLGYLVDHPPIPNKQTDIEKLDSHGFDRKKSFRHRK